jgi:hypothetical protein
MLRDRRLLLEKSFEDMFALSIPDGKIPHFVVCFSSREREREKMITR